MKLKPALLKASAALLGAVLILTSAGLASKAAGTQKAPGPPKASVIPQRCSGIPAMVVSIFGPYEYGGSGSDKVRPGALPQLAPPGGFVTNCLFARKLDESGSIPRDSDILSTGFVVLSSPAAFLQTWNSITSRFAMNSVNQRPYHYAENSGVSIGYRDGLNEIAWAFWKDGTTGSLHAISGSSLRSLVYKFICAKC